MELIYMWINNCRDCIIKQEFNFSPIHRFRAYNLNAPETVEYCRSQSSVNIMKSKNITNITAIVGSNGVGKTSLLSFIANNTCIAKSNVQKGYEKYIENQYEIRKSIYIFEDNNKFIIYHNLENELKIINLSEDKYCLYHNAKKSQKILELYEMRKQMIVYLSNSSIVLDNLLQYSRSVNTYNVNLHLKSLYLISNRFYNSLWGIDVFDKSTLDTNGFAGIIQLKRNEQTFQELLDVLYYNYLKSNNITDYAGEFKDEIYVFFENIFYLSNYAYNDDIEKIEYKNNYPYEFDKKSDKFGLHYKYSEKYYIKREKFFEKYDAKLIEKKRRENAVNVLYYNLLFEVFFYKDDFVLPEIDFEKEVYLQLCDSIKQYTEYSCYLEDIKRIDDVLLQCKTAENIIGNPDDFACQYDKIVKKDNAVFYNFFAEMFTEGKSYALRYIRIRNLEMSSGERAMQNMLSWLVLIPQLDRIMSIEHNTYTNKLLLIDEIDLYSHPQWQRKIIHLLISTINKIEKMPIQIVITSHSPIILSDFPQDNVIYLQKPNDTESTISDEGILHKPTFGANIYTLFNDAFFMKNGVVGEYARNSILNVYDEFKSDEVLRNSEDYYESFINVIGDGIIKKEMKKMFKEKLEKLNYDKSQSK